MQRIVQPIKRRISIITTIIILLLNFGMLQYIQANNLDKQIPPGYTSKVELEPEKFIGFGDSGGAKVVEIDKPEFKKAIQVFCTNRWLDFSVAGAGYLNVLAEDVKKDDAMLITFRARTIETMEESEQGLFHVSVNKKRGELQDKSLASDQTVGKEWQQFFIPFKCKEDYADDQLSMAFECGVDARIIQFEGVVLYCYGTNVPLEKLPKTKRTYAGRELDAPWRKDAEKRIQKYRMSNYTIKVIDKNNKPVENAITRFKMLKHTYEFGTACQSKMFIEAEYRDYKNVFLELFNSGTFHNALKWAPMAGEWGELFKVDRCICIVKL